MANCKVEWYPNAKDKLINAYPDRIVYEYASQLLDSAFSSIPKGKTGDLRKTSKAQGVRGQNKNYYIGSYTRYAERVWKLPNNTNWTTPGTNGKWYEEYQKKNGKAILNSVVERNKLK
jgi:hypothetical protein